MTNRRYAAKADGNQREIVKALRKAGCWVQYVGSPFDLVCCRSGVWHFLEVKDPAGKRRLTGKQILFLAEIRNRAPVHVVESVEQALEVISGI